MQARSARSPGVIIVYRKGCVRLCGLKTHMEALPSYRFITGVIESVWSSIATAK